MSDSNKVWGRMPTFCGAFVDARTLPQHTGLEVAFIGRSNVGKSSLLNALFNTKKLARVSQTPGCTKALMLFKVDDAFYTMDLPGYGFNRQPKATQKQWVRAINHYLAYRRALSQVYLLIDGRRGALDADRDMFGYLNHYRIPHTCIITKIDKISEEQQTLTRKTLEPYLDKESTNGTFLETSSFTQEGVADVQNAILDHIGRSRPL